MSAQSIFLGIHCWPGKRAFTFAALDASLHLVALGEGDQEAAASYAAGLSTCVVALNAPASPSQLLLKEVVIPVRLRRLRCAEAELAQHTIPIPHTPAQEEATPPWILRGYKLYEALRSLGYCAYPTDNAPRQWMEVNAEAAFRALLPGKLLERETLEGRLQRQLSLYDHELPVGDPMDFFEEVTTFKLLNGNIPLKNIFSPEELDALVCAFTAWMSMHKAAELTQVGDEREGLIYLPGALPGISSSRQIKLFD
jgi:hypothetical protein